MDEKPSSQQQLLELLAKNGFHERYYDFVDAARQTASKERCTYEQFCEVLSKERLFEHCKKERFFWLEETIGTWLFTLKLAYFHSKLELIISAKRNGQTVGGVVPKLAREAAQVLDPEFTPQPLSPKIPFANQTELRAAAAFGVSLYEDVKSTVLSFTPWNTDRS
jgi:hypothetical protein